MVKLTTFLVAVVFLDFSAARPMPSDLTAGLPPIPDYPLEVAWSPPWKYGKNKQLKEFWTRRTCEALWLAGCKKGVISKGVAKASPSSPHSPANNHLWKPHVTVETQRGNRLLHLRVYDDGTHDLFDPASQIDTWKSWRRARADAARREAPRWRYGQASAQSGASRGRGVSLGVRPERHFPVYGINRWRDRQAAFEKKTAWAKVKGETSRGRPVSPGMAAGPLEKQAGEAQVQGGTSLGHLGQEGKPASQLRRKFPGYGIKRWRDRQMEFARKAKKAEKLRSKP